MWSRRPAKQNLEAEGCPFVMVPAALHLDAGEFAPSQLRRGREQQRVWLSVHVPAFSWSECRQTRPGASSVLIETWSVAPTAEYR
jgi:hypothetical protein